MQPLKNSQITTTFLLWYRPINFSHVVKSYLKMKRQLQISIRWPIKVSTTEKIRELKPSGKCTMAESLTGSYQVRTKPLWRPHYGIL